MVYPLWDLEQRRFNSLANDQGRTDRTWFSLTSGNDRMEIRRCLFERRIIGGDRMFFTQRHFVLKEGNRFLSTRVNRSLTKNIIPMFLP